MKSALCISIKSRKHPHERCPNQATRGEFCAKHCKSKVVWTSIAPRPRPFTRKQKTALESLRIFVLLHVRPFLRKQHGPALYIPDHSHNEKDIYSLDSVATIPFTYHFSYADSQKHLWIFDLRFLLHTLQYGNELKNPFSQELIQGPVLQQLQARADRLRKQKLPIVYAEPQGLTSEQVWNQKVLDVFLKLTSLGYGANVLWFESLNIRGHEIFYRKLYTLWHYSLHLTEADRERIVPGHASGRAPLFRWEPSVIEGRAHELKWWRKTNLGLMNAYLSRGQDRTIQGCGALYLLTALAQTHPRAAEAFPWLTEDERNPL